MQKNNSQPINDDIKFINLDPEYVSLFEFLGKAAGSELGRQVYIKSVQSNVYIKSKQVSNKKYTGNIVTYPKAFLELYFK
jgi:hypothetical protein